MIALPWPPKTETEVNAWLATVRPWPDHRSTEEQRRDEHLEARAVSRADERRNGDARWREEAC